jgi:hypothetical protein
MSELTGTWDATLQSPLGVIDIVLEFTESNGELSGTSTASGETVPLLQPQVGEDGARVTWGVDVTKPLRVHLDFDVAVDAGTLTGSARAGMLMPKGAVSGTRRA